MNKVSVCEHFKVRAGTWTRGEIIEEVIRTIQAEPKRLKMATWVTALMGRVLDSAVTKAELPACGTAACAGGWIGLKLGRVIDTGDDAIELLRLPTGVRGGVESCNCDGCAAKREGLGREETAAWKLAQIFSKVKAQPPQIIKELKAYVKEFEDVLGVEVVVPTRDELRAEVRRGR